MNRRQFTKTAALAPIAMALGAEFAFQQGVATACNGNPAPQNSFAAKAEDGGGL